MAHAGAGCVPRTSRRSASSPVAAALSHGGAAGGAAAAGIAGVLTLAEELAGAGGPAPAPSPSGVAPSSWTSIAPRPLEPGPPRDGIDSYPCRSASGEMEYVIAESPERAARACARLVGVSCVCTVEEIEARATRPGAPPIDEAGGSEE